jgi:hypothetical protein
MLLERLPIMYVAFKIVPSLDCCGVGDLLLLHPEVLNAWATIMSHVPFYHQHQMLTHWSCQEKLNALKKLVRPCLSINLTRTRWTKYSHSSAMMQNLVGQCNDTNCEYQIMNPIAVSKLQIHMKQWCELNIYITEKKWSLLGNKNLFIHLPLICHGTVSY